MKLNNNGWGIKEMLILSSILIFFFCLSIYFIYILYSSLDLNIGLSSEYIEHDSYYYLEDKIVDATKDYISDIELDLKNNVIIFLDDLIDLGYIEEIKDPMTKNNCLGYVDIKNKKIKAYITCDKYETKGYRK